MSAKEDNFYKNYNYLQMDKYLIEVEKIKDPIKKITFWKNLLIKYEKDLTKIKNENLLFEAIINLNPEYRYKKGSFLIASDFRTFCENHIEQIENFIILKENRYTRSFKNFNEVDEQTNLKTENKISFKPNQFNQDGAKLFEYLVENYIDLDKQYGLQKRFTNVWHFMKNDNNKKDIYKFYFTKDEYKAYVLEKFSLKITNTDKSINKYNEIDLIQLKNHVLTFEEVNKS